MQPSPTSPRLGRAPPPPPPPQPCPPPLPGPPLPPASRASPGAGSAGTSLWRWPRLCSRATRFSAQFPTLIPPRKMRLGERADAGRAGGPLATHAGALGGDAPATRRPATPTPAGAGSHVQGHIAGHPGPGSTPNLRRDALFSNPWASSARAGRRGRGGSGPLPEAGPRRRRTSRTHRSGRVALLRSSPGASLPRGSPVAPTAGEVQVVRGPRLTPHKPTWCRSEPTPPRVQAAPLGRPGGRRPPRERREAR